MKCPDRNCRRCERLALFRDDNKLKFEDYFNAPVPSFGDIKAKLLVVGMAPGLNGANQTGRPFTNDYAGDVLYPALQKFGFARGNYGKRANDGFELVDARVTNAVRCVPPQNKVVASEVKNCGVFLQDEIAAMPDLKVVLVLGAVAHNALLSVLGYRKSEYKFVHGAEYVLPRHKLVLFDSYHTSRYNINTGVLTVEMFEKVVAAIREKLDVL